MSDLDLKIAQLKGDIAKIQQWAQKSEEWLNQKRRLLTATEIAVLKNAHIFQTLNQLYFEKCHPECQTNQKSSSPSTEWGERYEPIAKNEMAKRHPEWLEVLELGLARHPVHTFLGASPDGLVLINRGGGQLELWLIEIKCPYSRKISRQMPYQYWLQMQTQLYVWTALLAQFGWNLKGCIYNENEFTQISESDSNLTQYWEHEVYLDLNFYESDLMPTINQFWSCIQAYFRNRKRKHSQIESEAPVKDNRKKLRALTAGDYELDTLVDGLYMSYLKCQHVITQKQYRNYINQDRLLDWLNLYGDEFGFPKDAADASDFKNYLGRQTAQLHELVFGIIQKQSFIEPGHCVKIGQTNSYLPEGSDQTFYDIHSNQRGLSQDHLRETIESMKVGRPIILNAYLYHPQLQTFGHYPILIKISFLKRLFPIAYQKLVDTGLSETNENQYTFIQIRYSKLKLCAKGLYLLNVGSQKFYKLEQAHLHEVLRFYQPKAQEMPSLVMGRKSTSTSKGKTLENYNAVTSFGVIDFVDRDKEAMEDFYAAREWLQELISEGRGWSIDPPSHDFLYPNCKNGENGSWGTYKMALAKKNRDLTLLWYVGQAERQRLWDSDYLVREWTELDISQLKFNDHIKSIIGNMIESQQTNQVINMSALKAKLLELKTPIEFYLDFEFVPDLVDDFKRFPMSSVDKYIYMIGNVRVDHGQNQDGNATKPNKQYFNYLVNRLEKKQEQVMLKTFLAELKEQNGNLPQITIYHWGSAEKSQLTGYLQSQDLMLDEWEMGQMAQKLKMVDLCELFKNYEVTLPNCFEYGLKEIARVFYENRWIQTYWSEGLNGENAMVAAIDAEVECQKGMYENLTTNPTMQRYIRYNYADCKIMEEIVSYVRSSPDTD